MPEKNDSSKYPKAEDVPFSYFTQKRFPEAEPILDPTSIFEEMDRGEGMAVDDEKTYHRTEK